ncbi:hypothetical protein SSX86_005316 [Deinandra increscens subsp. villosa]|uniref:non-specific serine/threonine protein kinase n=1 Tax=Deinandra increscens subsp. villosa TaxID=3103831 RepID=A0AAP0H9P5_9ASTR
MSLMEGVQHLKKSLKEIKLATNNFGDTNVIGRGGYGNVYKGELNISGQLSTVAVKRLDSNLAHPQGAREFLTEIQMLSRCRHQNLVSLVGFCDEGGEKILVYEYVNNESLDKHLRDTNKLSWIQRLQISVGMAHGLKYLHNDVGPQHRVVHRDIKSANILLTENLEAKISDFGLSKITPSNVPFTSVFTHPCGTRGYIDPQYEESQILTKETDVYAFGVVLFEILCGRRAFVKEEGKYLGPLAQQYYEENRLGEIILPDLLDQMKEQSLNTFTTVAYQCLTKSPKERPTMERIVEKLKMALELQACSKAAGVIRVGTWGRQSGGHSWSFELKENHNLQKITIGHLEVICSLMFTSEFGGIMSTPNFVAGCANRATVTEIMFEGDEKIVGISGTISTRDGYTVISSLSFQTTKRKHGPFGRATDSVFSIPWDKGSLVGFYGLAGNYIDSIGVYVKSHGEFLSLGTWGSESEDSQNIWSFELERNHYLKKITIGHGNLIYSLKFTTECRGVLHDSKMAGGENKEDRVTFEWDEEIKAIKGTVGLSRGNNAGLVIISSLSFVTNKGRTHGPFGRARGTTFTIPLEKGSFAGFYGLAANNIHSIGVYLKAYM